MAVSSTMLCSFTGDPMSAHTDHKPNRPPHAPKWAKLFWRDDRAAVLVEFAIILPMMLLVFAIIIEGSRLFISYQAAIGGVRDATRYLSRVVPTDICSAGGTLAGHTTKLQTIVGQSISGNAVLPTAVTLNSVTPSFACVTGDYRVNPAPIAQVTASVTVTFPFAGIFGLNNTTLGQITTSVTDSSRAFGV